MGHQAGFAWILVDTEHSPNEPPAVLSQLQAMQAGTAVPVVRPAWSDPELIKRLLDIGAPGILVPFVQNAEKMARAVAACRYPPRGIRGITASGRASRFGRVTDYIEKADDEICVLLQIETGAALDRLEAIAAVVPPTCPPRSATGASQATRRFSRDPLPTTYRQYRPATAMLAFAMIILALVLGRAGQI